jgi:hypothetical protein
MTSEKSRERAAASRNSPLGQCQDDLIQCEVRFLAVERKDLLGALLQWRNASTAWHRFANPVLAKALAAVRDLPVGKRTAGIDEQGKAL